MNKLGMQQQQRTGHHQTGYSPDSSGSDSLKSWQARRHIESVAQTALSASPAAATSSEIRFRGEQHTSFGTSRLSAQQKRQVTLLQEELQSFEDILRNDKKEDSSWCDCFSVPPSYGWRLGRISGKPIAYTMPGGLFADTASYQPGVASKILSRIGNEQDLKRYPLTLRYLLEQDAAATPQTDEDALESLFRLFVEMTAANEPGLGGLEMKVSAYLTFSYQVIFALLGRNKVTSIIEQVEQNGPLAKQVHLEDNDLMQHRVTYIPDAYRNNE